MTLCQLFNGSRCSASSPSSSSGSPSSENSSRTAPRYPASHHPTEPGDAPHRRVRTRADHPPHQHTTAVTIRRSPSPGNPRPIAPRNTEYAISPAPPPLSVQLLPILPDVSQVHHDVIQL